jgi:type II secretory pathway pseudopilin PulG
MLRQRHGYAPAAGFSIIELLVSVVLGLILVGAVLALVVSVTRANAETIRATRLTQEMRTLVDVIGREVTRARYLQDPLDNVGSGIAADDRMNVLDDSTAGCLRFAYFDPDPDRNPGTNNPAIRAVAFALRNGALWVDVDQLDPATTPVTPPTCAEALTRLSSPEVNVRRFRAEILDDAVDPVTLELLPGNEDSLLALEIEAGFVDDTSGLNIVRTVTERQRIGSSRVTN